MPVFIEVKTITGNTMFINLNRVENIGRTPDTPNATFFFNDGETITCEDSYDDVTTRISECEGVWTVC